MEEVTGGFIFILLSGFAVAIVVTLIAYALKQRRVKRLKDPRNDHYR